MDEKQKNTIFLMWELREKVVSALELFLSRIGLSI
jgi:hypothetical protein